MNLARFMTPSIDRYYSVFDSILAPAICLTMNVKAIEYRTRINYKTNIAVHRLSRSLNNSIIFFNCLLQKQLILEGP